jgi:hypothetical protein
MLFKELIKLSIPSTILDNKLNADVIDIVLDYVEANTSLSYDISKVFTGDNAVIKEEFVNTYLQNISSAFEGALYNTDIKDKLTEVYASIGQTYDPSTLPNIADVFTDEYLNVSKTFKQRKGTSPAIKFAYNAIRNSKIQSVDVSPDVNDPAFNIELGTPDNPAEPFMFRVEGSLYKEVYENAIKPIVHPVGFGYIYSKLLAILFTEYVDVKLSYTNRDIQVKCNNGANYFDYSDKDVSLIYDESDVNGRIKTTILFSDSTYLVRDYNTTVAYYNVDGTVIVQYPDSCALFSEYTLVLTSAITDAYTFLLENSEVDYFTIGGGSIGPDLIIGSFIIASEAELYNVELLYSDNSNSYVMQYPHAALIGNNIDIGNSLAWDIGHVCTQYHNIGEDNYFVYQEVQESFDISII